MQVLAFNGKPVKNLKCLADMVENCDDEFLKFNLEYDQVLIFLTHPVCVRGYARWTLICWVCIDIMLLIC